MGELLPLLNTTYEQRRMNESHLDGLRERKSDTVVASTWGGSLSLGKEDIALMVSMFDDLVVVDNRRSLMAESKRGQRLRV